MDIEQERREFEQRRINKMRNLIAPTRDVRKQRLETFKTYVYYGVIGVILLLTTVLIPFLAGGITEQGFDYYIPKSTSGWIIFWAIRIGTVLGNIAVYGLFKAQAKTNIRYDENYLKACELLNKLNGEKGFIPMSPKKKSLKDWTTKGIFMVITTAAESIVIGTLIINFDFITFLSCISSSITAIVFGVVQMVKDEVYYTDEYLLYAEYITKEIKTCNQNNLENTQSIQTEESSLANQTNFSKDILTAQATEKPINLEDGTD